MPKKKQNDFTPQIDFKEQTPEMQLKEVKPDPLYEKRSFPVRIRIRANMPGIQPRGIKSQKNKSV